MTVAWMTYALLVGTLVSLAAYAMDGVCRLERFLYRRQYFPGTLGARAANRLDRTALVERRSLWFT